MADAGTAPITIRCKCGKKLKMPGSTAGRRAKCPECAHVFVVPSPEPDTADNDDSQSLLSELAGQAHSAPAAPQAAVPTQTACPKCNAVMPASAVLCVQCGFDTRHDNAHRGASAGAAVVSKLAARAGTFLFGCLLSGAGALVGALIWFSFTMATGYSIGWIAWGVGALAGFGMLKGYGEANTNAGIIAAGFALTGVVAAKVLIFAFVMHALLTGNTSDIDLQREYVKSMMAAEELGEQEFSSDEQAQAAWEAAYDRADVLVARYSDDEARDAWQKFRDSEPDAPADMGFDAAGFFSGFVEMMFSPIDLLWAFLAVSSAFKIGIGGSAD